ncbi:PAS domain-containing protein, partial [Parasphingorhabdus sp.]
MLQDDPDFTDLTHDNFLLMIGDNQPTGTPGEICLGDRNVAQAGSGKSSEDNAVQEHPWYGGIEFRTLAESIPALVFVSDANGSNIYCNVQFQRYTGMRPEEMLGDGWLNALHPDDRERAAETWLESWSEGSAYDTRYRFRSADGTFRWHLVRGLPVRDAQGDIVRWIGSCTDVEDLIAHISIKSQSESILEALGSASDLVVYAKDAEGRFIYSNAAGYSAIGRKPEEVTGKMARDLTAESAEAAVIQVHDEEVLAARKSMTFEENWTMPGAETKCFRSTKVPLPLPDGSVGIAALSVEITDAEALQSDHAEMQDHLRQRIDSLPNITWVADASGALTEVNQAWHDHSGLIASMGMDFKDLIAEESADEFFHHW